MAADRDPVFASPCPGCGASVDDLDGFGVLAHDDCGYCSHPDRDGGVCKICGHSGGVVTAQELADAMRRRASRTTVDNSTARFLNNAAADVTRLGEEAERYRKALQRLAADSNGGDPVSRAEELARVVDQVLAAEGHLAGGSARWSLRELARLAEASHDRDANSHPRTEGG